MKLTTLLTLLAEFAVLAIWAAVGLAANESLDQHEAERKAGEAAAAVAAVVLHQMDDKPVQK